jgi:hypothetical protein
VTTDQSRPWRIRMLEFVAFMRSRGHHYTWMHDSQVARPIGVFALKFHDNDNRIGGIIR